MSPATIASSGEPRAEACATRTECRAARRAPEAAKLTVSRSRASGPSLSDTIPLSDTIVPTSDAAPTCPRRAPPPPARCEVRCRSPRAPPPMPLWWARRAERLAAERHAERWSRRWRRRRWRRRSLVASRAAPAKKVRAAIATHACSRHSAPTRLCLTTAATLPLALRWRRSASRPSRWRRRRRRRARPAARASRPPTARRRSAPSSSARVLAQV